MNLFPFFIFLQLFVLQILLFQISAQNENFYFNAQIVANALTEQPKLSPNGSGRFRLSLAKITHNDLRDYQTRLEDETDLEDFAPLKIPQSWIHEMVPPKTRINPRMVNIHSNNLFAFKVSTADGRKRTNYIQFKMTELTLRTYFIILEDATFQRIDAKIYDELSISANIYPHDRTYLDPRTIDQCLTSEQWDLIKQKIPEALHSSAFNALKNEKNPFRHPQIKIRRRKNHYKIDVHEGEDIQQIEQRQQISLPFSLPPVPPSMPSRNSALERFKQPPAKKGKTTTFMIPLPSSSLKPKTPPKTPSSSSKRKKLAPSPVSISKNSVPSPEPIDLDTPPMSPKNIGEEENMTINLDDILNTVDLNTPPTSPMEENGPINLDDTLNINNNKARRLLLAHKGKSPMEYDEAGTSKNGINPGNEKFVELNKIITTPKRKIAEIYEKELKWGRQQKRGSHSNLAELGNLGVIGGGGKVNAHQKPEQIAYVDNNESESTMTTDDEEGNERDKFKMEKFAKSLLRAHHSQMKNNLEEGESLNSKVHHNFNEMNIPGHAHDDLIYFNDSKKLKNYDDDVIDTKIKRKLNFN